MVRSLRIAGAKVGIYPLTAKFKGKIFRILFDLLYFCSVFIKDYVLRQSGSFAI